MEENSVESPIRILQICSKPPLPHGDGGAMAMHNLSELLLAVPCSLRICTLSTPKHTFNPMAYDTEWKRKTQVAAHSLDSRPSLSALVKSVFTGRSFFFGRFQHRSWQRFIKQAIDEHHPQIVILDGLYAAGCLEALEKHNLRIWLRAHNIEWKLWESVAEIEPHPVKKILFRRWMRTLRKVECGIWSRVHRILAITPQDAECMKRRVGDAVPVSVLPATAPRVNLPEMEQARVGLHAYHLGGLGWLPNRQGVIWFLEKVWPEIVRVVPEVQFHLGGEGVADLLPHFPSHVCVHGVVADLPAFLQSADVLVLPYKSGGGLRIKALEALSHGKVVLGTQMGLAGIPKHFDCVIQADDPHEFAHAFLRISQWSADYMEEQRRHARALADSAFGFNSNLEKLKSIIQHEFHRQ